MKRLGTPDKLDKYRAHLVDGADLKDDELEMLAKYRKAHGLLCLGFGRGQVLATLEKEYELSQPQLYAIVRESIKLYGSVEEVDKKGQRVISHENYKLLGLFEAEKTALDPKAFLIPVPMDFSTDPAVLREQETEDTDYEDVSEEGEGDAA